MKIKDTFQFQPKVAFYATIPIILITSRSLKLRNLCRALHAQVTHLWQFVEPLDNSRVNMPIISQQRSFEIGTLFTQSKIVQSGHVTFYGYLSSQVWALAGRLFVGQLYIKADISCCWSTCNSTISQHWLNSLSYWDVHNDTKLAQQVFQVICYTFITV